MKPYPHQVLSHFNEGLTTAEIAEMFKISESEAYELLLEGRKTKPDFPVGFTPQRQKRARNKARLVCRSTKPVSLAPLKFLESKA